MVAPELAEIFPTSQAVNEARRSSHTLDRAVGEAGLNAGGEVSRFCCHPAVYNVPSSTQLRELKLVSKELAPLNCVNKPSSQVSLNQRYAG